MPGQIRHRLRLGAHTQRQTIEIGNQAGASGVVEHRTIGGQMRPARPVATALRELFRVAAVGINTHELVWNAEKIGALVDDAFAVSTPVRKKNPRRSTDRRYGTGLPRLKIENTKLAFALFIGDECDALAIGRERRLQLIRRLLDKLLRRTTR